MKITELMEKATLLIVLTSLNFTLVSPDLFEVCIDGYDQTANCAQLQGCLTDVGNGEGYPAEQEKIDSCIDTLGLAGKTVAECTDQLRECAVGEMNTLPNRYLIVLSFAVFCMNY